MNKQVLKDVLAASLNPEKPSENLQGAIHFSHIRAGGRSPAWAWDVAYEITYDESNS